MQKTTDQLVTGDVVYTHGMFVRINETESYEYPDGTVVYWSEGTVLNWDEAKDFDFLRGIVTEDKWRIQGNHLAHWTVKV